MYLIAIAWIYVALMMAVAEATNANGTVLGAIVTFFLYGLGPVALVVYLMQSPARRKAIKAREAQEEQDIAAAALETVPNSAADSESISPDTSSHAARTTQDDAVAPVRKEP